MQKVKKNLKQHKFIIFLFLFSFIIRLITVLWITPPVTGEFKTIYEASLELLNNTTSYKSMPTFLIQAYKMGQVLYQTILLSIINNITFLKIINVLLSSVTVVLIYLIGKQLSNQKSAAIIFLIYSIFLFPILINTVLTNEILPMLLILIAILILIKKKDKVGYFIIIGILLGLSRVLKKETAIIMIALFLYTVFLMTKTKSRKRLLTAFTIILLTYLSLFTLTSQLLKTTKVSPNGLENKNPTYELLSGLNIATNGKSNAGYTKKFAYNKEDTVKELQKVVRNNYPKFAKLFVNKIKNTWLNSSLSWSLHHLKDQDKVEIIEAINQIFIYFFFLLTLLSSITFLKGKYNHLQVLLTIILLLYFVYYIFVETNPIYAYSLQIFQALLSTTTINYVLENRQEGGETHGKVRK